MASPLASRKKGGRRKKSKKDDGALFFQHPFSGIDPALLRQAFADAGRRRAAQFPQIIDRIDRALREINPLTLVAMISGWSMLTPVGDGGTSNKTMLSEIEQHHMGHPVLADG